MLKGDVTLVKKFSILISILLGFNIIISIVALLFYEFSTTVNVIVDYSMIPLFLLLSLILAKYITENFNSPALPLLIILFFLVILRAGEVIFKTSVLEIVFFILGGVSFFFPQVVLNEILSVGDDFLYIWSIFAFPAMQIIGIAFFCFVFSKINAKKNSR